MTKGTVAEIRDRMFRVLKGCQVEMLIIDEADRLKPKTFAEVRDIFDKLDIAVVLVGTDRLDAAIKRDKQVYNRFRACHRFGKLSGEDFVEAIASTLLSALRKFFRLTARSSILLSSAISLIPSVSAKSKNSRSKSSAGTIISLGAKL
jgi:DNA transposition AAA+ family ATPase